MASNNDEIDFSIPPPAPPLSKVIMTSNGSGNFGLPAEPESGAERLVKSIRDSKRRLVQNVLQKVGAAEPSKDQEFTILKERHNELYKHTKLTIKHLKNYMNSLVTLGYGCGIIGEDSIRFKFTQDDDDDDNNNTEDSRCQTLFSNSMAQIDVAAHEMTDNAMINLIEMFQIKCDDMKDLKREMESREALKVDYDSALRKLKKVRESGLHADISRREIKLRYAEESLRTSTESIMKRLNAYEAQRSTIFDHEIELFRQAQAQFFSFCAAGFDKDIPTAKTLDVSARRQSYTEMAQAAADNDDDDDDGLSEQLASIVTSPRTRLSTHIA